MSDAAGVDADADADGTGGAGGGEGGADAAGGAADAGAIGGTSRAADADGAGVLCGARDDEHAPVIAIAKSARPAPRTLRASHIDDQSFGGGVEHVVATADSFAGHAPGAAPPSVRLAIQSPTRSPW